ncbi:MAG TPA: DUF488 family protein [Patescibacteria group bacterium]|nr:DUF488 family protein [Patescibacteria group bacterium]
MNVEIKRIYEKVLREDGARVLVDRLWPRGISKERARLDLWMKDLGPSTELRKWFSHDPKKWREFRKKYITELKEKKDMLEKLIKIAKEKKKITLLFGAKDTEHNEAIVIKELLNEVSDGGRLY